MTALATGRYATFRPSLGVPVQTSLSRPKWPLDYELREEVRELMPRGLMKLDGEAFIAAYRERLDRLDLDALAAQFAAISARNGDRRVVLLCFEDVRAGKLCHRRVFADHWLEHRGERVPEVGGGAVTLERHPHYDHVVRPI